MELTDLRARTLCANSRSAVESLIEALLRMQNDVAWQRPISLYLGLGRAGQPPMDALDVLTLCDVVRVLRSPVHTFALGLVSGAEPLLLAAGRPGQRLVLPHAMVAAGPVSATALPLPNGTVGLHPGATEPSLHRQGQHRLHRHLRQLSRELGLPPRLWSRPRILGAADIIRAGLADAVVPVHSLEPRLTPVLPHHEH